jgi:hypothetical protein
MLRPLEGARWIYAVVLVLTFNGSRAAAQTPRDSAAIYRAVLETVDRSPVEIRVLITRRLEELCGTGCGTAPAAFHSMEVVDSIRAQLPRLQLCAWQTGERCPGLPDGWAALSTIRAVEPDRFAVDIQVFANGWLQEFHVELTRCGPGWKVVQVLHTGST